MPRVWPEVGREKLEVNLCSKLHYAEAAGSIVSSSRRIPTLTLGESYRCGSIRILPRPVGVHCVVNGVEVRMIECVVRFETKLDVTVFVLTHGNVLEQG